MHPLQVARAVALAKASSAAGALLLGLYAGLFAWTFPRRDELAAAEHDALISGITRRHRTAAGGRGAAARARLPHPARAGRIGCPHGPPTSTR